MSHFQELKDDNTIISKQQEEIDLCVKGAMCGSITETSNSSDNVNSKQYKPISIDLPHNNDSGHVLMHYYCPRCHTTYTERYHSVTNSSTQKMHISMNSWIDCSCGGCAIEIDANILDVIVKLNKIGLKTEYSCEGHDWTDPSYILFDSCATHFLKDIDPPYLWEYQTDSSMESVAECGHVTTNIVDELDTLYNFNTWSRYGSICVLYAGMKVAVINDDKEMNNGIYECIDPHQCRWSKLTNGNSRIKLGYKIESVKSIRPILGAEPDKLKSIYGSHFDVYKNLYLNALRAWADDVETFMITNYGFKNKNT